MKLCAFGDLHIGQGASIGRTPGERLAEQAAATQSVLAQTRRLGCSFVLFAGDAWEKRSPTPDEILVLERALLEHRDAGGAPVLAIPGNHDVANIDAGTALDILADAGLISLYREPGIVWLDDGVVLCMLPWVPVHRLALDDGERDEINSRAARHLENVARGLHAEALELGAETTILLTHFSTLGSSTETAADVGVFREPVLNVDDLAEFDCIVMGHIHMPQTVGAAKRAHYVGSLVPLNFGETGAHGFLELDVNETLPAPDGVEMPKVVARRVTDQIPYRPFLTFDVDLIDSEVTGEMLTDSAWIGYHRQPEVGERPYVKLRYRCSEDQAVAIDGVAIKAMLEERIAHRAWVVPVVERTARVRQEIGDDTTDVEALEAYLRARVDRMVQAGDAEPDVARLAELGAGYLAKART